MMKILFVVSNLRHGGASIAPLDLAEKLAERGHRVLIITSGENKETFHFSGVEVKVLKNPFRNPLYHYFNPLIMFQLIRIIRSFSPDIINYHNLNLQSFSLFSLLLSNLCPSVWTLHDLWPICVIGWPEPVDCNGYHRDCNFCPTFPRTLVKLNKLVKESVYRLSPFEIVCPSKWLRRHLEKSVLSKKNIFIVNYGIDQKKMSAGENEVKPAGVGNFGGKKIIMFPGGSILAGKPPALRKGWRYLKEALEYLSLRRRDFLLLYIGDKPDGNVDFDFPVRFVPSVSRDMLKYYYKAADIFVLPTIADNLPLSILEAMACETAVLATNTGGIAEVIDDGKNGLICQPKDSFCLAEKLYLLLENDEYRKDIAGKGYRKYLEKLTMDKCGKKYEKIFEETIISR